MSTIEPGDHVRIGDGDVDWVVQSIENGRGEAQVRHDRPFDVGKCRLSGFGCG